MTSGSHRLDADPAAIPGAPSHRPAARVQRRLEDALGSFPWRVEVRDWTGGRYDLGGTTPHWYGEPLQLTLRSEAAGETIASWRPLQFLEAVLAGEADLDGNLYLLAHVRRHARFDLRWQDLPGLLARNLRFQNPRRAQANVRSHYDVPQEAIDLYLDRRYRAYSCAWFEDPRGRDRRELERVGNGERDDFDALEKAQWRKFANAADWVAPGDGETLLDIGCGYGGQLEVALERFPGARVTGWTHSRNQVAIAQQTLAERFGEAAAEVHLGDYRQDDRVFDHVTSTGMVSHVGPRGLRPYVKQVRRRIRTGGRYLHHALMKVHSPVPLDFQIGPAFHKRYVWPGFHWFTVGEHVRALERGGFSVRSMVSLSEHYAKTTACWHERLMERADEARALLGEPTFRAWRIFLAGASGDIEDGGIEVYRLYCVAV